MLLVLCYLYFFYQTLHYKAARLPQELGILPTTTWQNEKKISDDEFSL